MPERKLRLSGHQTFPFRYGWLEKGCGHIRARHRFTDADALASLGVGKNMVDSIRYWCEMFALIDGDSLTPLAHAILDTDAGLDPWLEDDASLWLLHWTLCADSPFLNAASILFGEIRKREFTRADWLDLLLRRSAGPRPVSASTLDRDIDCCLRMYAQAQVPAKKRILEITLASPMQSLGLLSASGGVIRFAYGPKPSLPPEIIGYAIHAFMRRKSRQWARLSELAADAYSPGQIFQIDENSLAQAIFALCESRPDAFGFTSSEGIETVRCSLERCADGRALLSACYAHKRGMALA